MPGWKNSSRKTTLPPNWGAIRQKILARDKHRCQRVVNGLLCGRPANQVDHIDPRGGDSPENLESLCRAHHASKSSAEGAKARWAKRKKRRRAEPPHPGLLPRARRDLR